MLRYILPLLGLTLLAIFAALYAFDSDAYYRALTTIGIKPTKYPFVDWEYIGANIRCWNNNIDVYIADPCDVMNRPYNYSPLSLRAVSFRPTEFGRADRHRHRRCVLAVALLGRQTSE